MLTESLKDWTSLGVLVLVTIAGSVGIGSEMVAALTDVGVGSTLSVVLVTTILLFVVSAVFGRVVDKLRAHGRDEGAFAVLAVYRVEGSEGVENLIEHFEHEHLKERLLRQSAA